ncbi:MAG: hypothetical protein ACR5LG_07965 [Sodalis sp. (in: enterobacteria)]|uniref:hypothetical protein n=1 Tax=Sodalis sp. (in: enterobacteria) TaxID=1898979 RepID=UPI003F4153D8
MMDPAVLSAGITVTRTLIVPPNGEARVQAVNGNLEAKHVRLSLFVFAIKGQRRVYNEKESLNRPRGAGTGQLYLPKARAAAGAHRTHSTTGFGSGTAAAGH